MADIPNDLELNQEDFSDVLPRLPDDLQDFDLFEGCHTAFSHAPLLISYTFISYNNKVLLLLFSNHNLHMCVYM